MALSPSLVVLGAGGHAIVVAEAATLSGLELGGYLSFTPCAHALAKILGPYLGTDCQIFLLLQQGVRFVPAIGFVDAGGAARRAELLRMVPEQALATIVHPQSIISPSACLGAGSFVAGGALLGACATVGTGAIVNSGAVIDHDCQLGANCHVATGARVLGGVSVGDNVLIGAGAVIRQGIHVGSNAVVGAGAVVVRDVAEGTTVMGVPAASR